MKNQLKLLINRKQMIERSEGLHKDTGANETIRDVLLV